MDGTTDEYTQEQIEETKRFVYTLYTELALQEHSIFDALQKLADESTALPYKNFFQTARTSVMEGSSLSNVFLKHPSYKNLFMQSFEDTLRIGEENGSMVEDLLALWKSYKATKL